MGSRLLCADCKRLPSLHLDRLQSPRVLAGAAIPVFRLS